MEAREEVKEAGQTSEEALEAFEEKVQKIERKENPTEEELKNASIAAMELAVKALEDQQRIPPLVDEAQRMRAGFAKQLEQNSRNIENCEKQLKMLKNQTEQIKGALFALDTLSASAIKESELKEV